ncbi:MAG: hypothetical protein ACXW4H_05990 [Candidatus Limnocylindrales bacterium]
MPLFGAASFAAAGTDNPGTASLAAFAIVGSAGVGCVVAGVVADRLGRTMVTIVAMALSGSCAIGVGLLFGAAPAITVALGVIWGLTVVADSAQFSAAVSELAPSGTAGSALAIQTALGFLLTGVTILLVGLLGPGSANGWRIAFALLALGPVVGIVVMGRLRRRPESVQLVSGNR